MLALAACQETITPEPAEVQVTIPPELVLVPPVPGAFEPLFPGIPVIPALPPGQLPPGQALQDQGLQETLPALPAAPPPIVVPEGPVSVALLLPLTGPTAPLGEAMLDAAQMALFDVQADKLLLLPGDTEGTPAGAARAVAAALADGASLIIGPLFSGSVAAVTPLTLAAGVNVIAFSSDRKVARPGVFVMGFLPDQQVSRVIRYAVSRGLRRFAALTPASNYGQTVVRAMRQATEATETELTDIVFFPPNIQAASEVADIVRIFTDYDARRQRLLDQRAELEARGDEVSLGALRRLEGLDTLGEVDFEAVLVPEGGSRLLTVAPLLPFYDVDTTRIRMLGTTQWESAALDQEPALLGGWFAAPPPAARADFEARFEKIFGHRPPRLATLAYDAVALAGALSRLSGGVGFNTEILTNAGGFRGVDGLFRFTPDGASERGLAVLEVTRRGIITVDEAPKSFTGL